jgi:hypothetical protein
MKAIIDDVMQFSTSNQEWASDVTICRNVVYIFFYRMVSSRL